MPTLAELVDDFPAPGSTSTSRPTEPSAALADFVEERGAEDRVLVGSFSRRRLREFRRLTGGPGAHLGRAPRGGRLPARAQRPARRPADRASVAALQIPHRRGPADRSPRRGLVRRAHAAGKHVHVWTVDDPAEMRALLDRGVDGLMTDRTDILKAVLTERGQWRGPSHDRRD